MKASLKLRDHEGQLQKPVIKVKLPLHILGFPIYTGFKICGHIQEIALRLGSSLESLGPSLELSYRPNQICDAFTLGLKAGFRPWSSSPSPSISVSAEFNLSSPCSPSFMLRVKPEIGDFSLRHDFKSEVVPVHDQQTMLDKHPDAASPYSSSSSNMQNISSSSMCASKQCDSGNPWSNDQKNLQMYALEPCNLGNPWSNYQKNSQMFASEQCDLGNPWSNDQKNVQGFGNATFPCRQSDNDVFALSQPHTIKAAGCACNYHSNHNSGFGSPQAPSHLNMKKNVGSYDTINIPNFDATPHASESSVFTGIDAKQSLDLFVQERNAQSNNKFKYNNVDSDPFLNYTCCQSTPRSNGFCETPLTNRAWDTPFEAISSTASVASSNQENNDNLDSDCITSWGDHSFFKGNRIRACTHLPISAEAQLKIWWSVSTLKGSPKVPVLPILVLDKISLEGSTTASHSHDSSSENHHTRSTCYSEKINNWKHDSHGKLNPSSEQYVCKNQIPFWETFVKRRGID